MEFSTQLSIEVLENCSEVYRELALYSSIELELCADLRKELYRTL